MIVLTLGAGVNGFTLDPDIGNFILTHPDMKVPEECREFAVNMSNERFWEPPVQRYVDEASGGARDRAARTSTCAGSPPWWRRSTAS